MNTLIVGIITCLIGACAGIIGSLSKAKIDNKKQSDFHFSTVASEYQALMEQLKNQLRDTEERLNKRIAECEHKVILLEKEIDHKETYIDKLEDIILGANLLLPKTGNK